MTDKNQMIPNSKQRRAQSMPKQNADKDAVSKQPETNEPAYGWLHLRIRDTIYRQVTHLGMRS